MKAIVLISAFIASFSFAQADLTEISDAIRLGDAKSLSYYFDQEIELNIGRVDDVYSKDQAVKVLHAFFGKYPPKSFRNLHHGASSTKHMKYYIGKLHTDLGTFRSTILLEEKAGKMLIKQFSLERQ